MAAPCTTPFLPAHKGALYPGDVVRLEETLALPAGCPLKQGHIYTVLRVDGLLHDMHTCLVLAGAETWTPFAWRFALVARGPHAPVAEASAQGAEEARAIVERMTQVMRERERETGACDRHDLARAGFTAAQIIEYADEARGLAGAPSQQVAA
ncbi:hypothetical protein V5G24_23230 [Xanthobacter sp. VTT E-85241]|uniref:hypothetical protein n=1 Tax=Roseixanthobacter finlandensis TaxID=3119922 RepID=UPI003729F201